VLRKYIISSFRNLIRQKLFYSITIGGVAIGIASFALIMLYINYEQGFDKQWKDRKRIVRLYTLMDSGERQSNTALTPFPLAPSLEKSLPQTAATLRVTTLASMLTLRTHTRKVGTERLYLADPGFFNFFDYSFLEGSANHALTKSHHVVLTRSMAHKLFNNEPALGKEIWIGPNFPLLDSAFVVCGVIEDPPYQTHLRPQVIASNLVFPDYLVDMMNQNWDFISFYTYLKLNNEQQLTNLQNQLDQWKIQTIDPWLQQQKLTYNLRFNFQPITSIHHETSLEHDIPTNIGSRYVHIFGFGALLILIIVGINYVNLSTAHSVNRASEVGMRKTMGANNQQIIRQFLGESVFISLLAFILGIIMAELLLPFFNKMLETNLILTGNLFYAKKTSLLLIILGISLIMGLVSGFLPAVFLAKYKPIEVVGRDFWYRTGNRISKRSLNLRRTLVLFQFGITVILIVATLTILQQIQFMRNKDLGFEKKSMLVITIPDEFARRQKIGELKRKLASHPGIIQTTSCFNLPGYSMDKITMTIEEKGRMRQEIINYFMVDQTFIETLSMNMLEGCFFNATSGTSDETCYVINQEAKKIFRGDPLEATVETEQSKKGKITGIMENFHYAPLNQPIEPVLFIYKPEIPRFLGIKIEQAEQDQVMRYIQRVWDEFDSKHLYEQVFLEEKLTSWYRHERRILTVMSYFSLLTLLLASLGLFGLSCFMALRKKREIAIRKAMGSSSLKVVTMFMRQYLKWILLANLMGWPVAWFIMNRWLNSFAYHISLTFSVFIAALIITLVLALVTIGYHANKSANTNPARVLKDE